MTKSTPILIKTEASGFYEGCNRVVALGSKVLIGALILWAAIFPEKAGKFLAGVNAGVNAHFGPWYLYVMAFFILVCFAMAIWPPTGKLRLGRPDEKPEFSRFSWFAMLFGAGIGIGMMTYATGEPVSHYAKSPETIMGLVEPKTLEAAREAYKWSFLHWGLSAWGCYTFIGLALAYPAYAKGQPLTIRSSLVPLFGKWMSGPLGNIVDIVAIIATALGVAVAIGAGVSQFASGLENISGAKWLLNAKGEPSTAAMILCLVIIMGLSTWSALSGVGRGIKWLSNLNMSLSFFLITFFVLFGATVFIFKSFVFGLWDYVINLPSLLTNIWTDDGTSIGSALAGWQGGWTIFIWAWWIAFAPFVGLFFARISRGRSVREYVFGAMIIPTMMAFVWFASAGGNAIWLEHIGEAKGSIIDAPLSAQLFETINVMLGSVMAKIMSFVIVILLLTYLVTSADSAILVTTTISAAGGTAAKSSLHIMVWGAVFTAVIGVLILAGGLNAINTAMMIGALPFSFVMGLMGIAVMKALISDSRA